MVGNTYPYTIQDWVEDITLASENGIDGFALNIGKEEWQISRVADCYEAARRARTSQPFRVFLSLDMTSIPGASVDDALLIRDHVSRFAGHPHQLRFIGKVLLSTFSGGKSRFGQKDLNSAWNFVKGVVEAAVGKIHFVPAFFIDPARYPAVSSMDGFFNWNGGWPTRLTPQSPRHEIRMPRLDGDLVHLKHLGGRTFMAAVTPWFFTHYGPDSWNKNWIYRGDDWLFVRRWEQLIAMRDQIDIVQIISYNDYGESHYVGPIKGAQPNSQAWVDGFPHEPWLHLAKYYARAFKEGVYPAIEADTIYMWARPHLKSAVTDDPVPRPRDWELTDDMIWVVVFAMAPAVVTTSSSDDGHDAQIVEVPSGVSKLSHQVDPKGSMRVRMERDGVLVAQCTPERHGFRFQERPGVYSFNVYCAMSGP
ncbi:glycoside hydrolase [Fomitopsis serialis]|uniref:glycoside hydrolase n=1 Tax=Fomitopsis serialis TaxID=139415 RepID=UPI0020087B48|nr:glycoside hydrolase [Neoantrodia serialis]KAH9927778.1 glycoside hydrolase [Neoantrodia serialis]